MTLAGPDGTMAALGAGVGLTLALTGAGGGALAVPLLVLVAGLPMAQAAPVSLVAVGLSAAVGALLGLRQGIVRWRAALLLGLSGMAAAPLGVTLAQHVPGPALLLLFALFLLSTARRMWAPPALAGATGPVPPCLRPEGAQRLRWTPACFWVLGRVGALTGLLSGLLGVGGGFVIVPALDRHSNLDLPSIQATSLSVIALVALGGLGAAAWHGQVPTALAAPFGLGTLGGLLAGRRAARHLPAAQLRKGFALAALVMAALVSARALGALPA